MKSYYLSFLAFLFCYSLVRGHNPNEIAYFFQLDKNELIIHLTPKSAIDILEESHPLLQLESQFQLDAYTPDFERYFQEHVHLGLNGSPIRLQLMETQLDKHDAKLTFRLEEIPLVADDFKVTISSFVGLYKRLKNHVFLIQGNHKQHYALNATQTSIRSTMPRMKKQKGNWRPSVFSGGMLLLGLSVVLTLYRKKRVSVKP